MRFRPRYSLLTLQILTALVAGGVKLWRGPHRVVMSDPPTAEELTVWQWPMGADGSRYCFEPVTYEYDYVNEWNKRRYLCFKGRSTAKYPIPVGNFSENPEVVCLYLGHIRRTSEKIAELAKHEHVVCWLYSESTVRQEDILLKEIYFLTSRKKIYLYLNWPGLFNVLQPVELSDIDDDPEFRARVAGELVNIPDPQ